MLDIHDIYNGDFVEVEDWNGVIRSFIVEYVTKCDDGKITVFCNSGLIMNIFQDGSIDFNKNAMTLLFIQRYNNTKKEWEYLGQCNDKISRINSTIESCDKLIQLIRFPKTAYTVFDTVHYVELIKNGLSAIKAMLSEDSK